VAKFPTLAALARGKFSDLAAEAASERTFSYSGRPFSKQHRRMGVANLGAMAVGAACPLAEQRRRNHGREREPPRKARQRHCFCCFRRRRCTREPTPTHTAHTAHNTQLTRLEKNCTMLYAKGQSAQPDMFWRTNQTKLDPKSTRVMPLCLWLMGSIN
jgi:hypothetical protein